MAGVVSCPVCGGAAEPSGCESCGGYALAAPFEFRDQAARDRDREADVRDRAAELRDRGAEDRDLLAHQLDLRSASDQAQVMASQDQAGSDRDQRASDRDERSADRDQRAADDDLAGGGNAVAYDQGVSARERSGRDRHVGSVLRHETTAARLLHGEADARGKDRLLLAEHDRMRAADNREHAAEDREDAAGERADAARDRTESAVAARRAVETLESMSDAFYTLDAEWRFTYLNPQVEPILERRREDLLGKKMWEEFPESVGSLFDYQYRRALREQLPVRFEEVSEPLGRTLEVRVYPVTDGLAVYFSDVTNERLLDARLRQSQRLEALGQITAGVAHDFNNLLACIGGFAELGQIASTDAKTSSYFDQIDATTQKAVALTRQLLAFGRDQNLAPRVIDLNEVVDGLASLLGQLLPAGVRLRLALSPQPVDVFVDRSQLEQVLVNLVVNSRDAIDKIGSITVSTTKDCPAAVAHDLAIPAGWLQVTDTGCGIPPDVRPHIFDPFFSTKPPGTGTGLGLATIYGIVSQSGGSVVVDSTPDVGTTMTIALPAAQLPCSAARPQSRLGVVSGTTGHTRSPAGGCSS